MEGGCRVALVGWAGRGSGGAGIALKPASGGAVTAGHDFTLYAVESSSDRPDADGWEVVLGAAPAPTVEWL